MARESLRLLAERAGHELARDTVDLEHVMGALPRRPVDDAEITQAMELGRVWHKDGLKFFFGMEAAAETERDRIEAVRNIRNGAAEGLFIVTAPFHEVRLIVVKAADGRTFFGKEKRRYHCFLTLDDGNQAVAIGTTSSWLLALTKLSAILRQSASLPL